MPDNERSLRDPEAVKELYEELLSDTASHMDGEENVREVALLRAVQEIVLDAVGAM